MELRSRVAFSLALLAISSPTLRGQTSSPAPASLTNEARQRVVDSLTRTVERL